MTNNSLFIIGEQTFQQTDQYNYNNNIPAGQQGTSILTSAQHRAHTREIINMTLITLQIHREIIITRKLSYRKDDSAMRDVLEISESP